MSELIGWLVLLFALLGLCCWLESSASPSLDPDACSESDELFSLSLPDSLSDSWDASSPLLLEADVWPEVCESLLDSLLDSHDWSEFCELLLESSADSLSELLPDWDAPSAMDEPDAWLVFGVLLSLSSSSPES